MNEENDSNNQVLENENINITSKNIVDGSESNNSLTEPLQKSSSSNQSITDQPIEPLASASGQPVVIRPNSTQPPVTLASGQNDTIQNTTDNISNFDFAESAKSPESSPIITRQQIPDSPKKKRNKLKLALFSGLALILLVGASAGAYVGYILPNQPNNVAKKSVANLAQAKYFKTVQIILNVESGGEKTALTATAGTKNNVLRTDFALKYSIFNIEGSALYNQKDKTAYIKLNGISQIINQFLGGQNTNKPTDKWVKVSEKDLAELSGSTGSSPTSGSGSSTLKCYQSLLDFAKTDEFKNELLAIYTKNEFANAKKVGTDSIDGQQTTKYMITIDKNKAKNFDQQVSGSNIINNKLKNIDPKCTDINKTATEQENSASKLNFDNIYFWINSKKQLVQVKMDIADEEVKMNLQANFLTTDKLDYSIPTDAASGINSLLGLPSSENSQLFSGLSI